MRVLTTLALALLVVACKPSVTINNPAAPSEPEVKSNLIEFRAVGTPTLVRIRYSSPADGLAQTTTSLPFVASAPTFQSSAFLSLEATPISYPSFILPNFLSIQIVVNGNLFREAATSEANFQVINISGNWRK